MRAAFRAALRDKGLLMSRPVLRQLRWELSAMCRVLARGTLNPNTLCLTAPRIHRSYGGPIGCVDE